MNIRDRLVLSAGGLLLIVLAASLIRPAPADMVGTASPTPQPAPRYVRDGVVGTVTTLDPLYAISPAERDATALIFSGLTRLGPDGTIVPDLAEDWQGATDGASYTFHLRPDARWHDGAPVTADDVVFTIRTLQHPAFDGPRARQWRGVEVERVDARTVRFRLSTPLGAFLHATSQPLVPAHLLGDVPVDQRRDSGFGLAPVGSGPFALAEMDKGRIVLARAEPPVSEPGPALPPAEPTPSRDGRPRPLLEGLELVLYATPQEMAAAFARGEIDAAGGLPPELADRLAEASGVRTVRYPRTVLTAAVLNLRFDRPAFRDARVRRALLLAIDRQALLDDLLGGAGRVATTPISPASFAYDRAASGSVGHDLKEAARLLTAAGWKRGGSGWLRPRAKEVFSFEVSTVEAAANPVANAYAERVVAAWRRLGLRPRLVAYGAAELAERRLIPGRYDAAVIDVNLGLDPDLYPLLASSQAVTGGSNVSGYQSAKLDALLEAAREQADPTTRRTRFTALQKVLAAELPMLPLVFADYRYLVRETLVGPAPREVSSGSERFWDVLTWRLADGPVR